MNPPTLTELREYESNVGESFACDCFYLKQLIEYSAYTLTNTEILNLELSLKNKRIKFSQKDVQSYLRVIDDLIEVTPHRLKTIKDCAVKVRNVLTQQAFRSSFKSLVWVNPPTLN